MVEQLNARFLKRRMNKWVYIATVLDPRNKLDKCFPAGDAMTVADVKALYTAELMNIAHHHARQKCSSHPIRPHQLRSNSLDMPPVPPLPVP